MCVCVALFALWIYKISFMSLAVAFPVYRLAQRLPQNFFHLRLLPAPSADRSFPFPLLPSDLTAPRTRSKFGASLSNYLYGIHNFCWWSFTQAASRWLTMAAWSAWTSVYGIEYLGCGIRVWVGCRYAMWNCLTGGFVFAPRLGTSLACFSHSHTRFKVVSISRLFFYFSVFSVFWGQVNKKVM